MNERLQPSLPQDPREIYRRSFVRDALESMNIRAAKWLGQNFLYQLPTLEACLNDAGIDSNVHVFEIGPGLGHLTVALLLRGCHVTSVEIDPLLAAHMGNLAHVYKDVLPGQVEIIEGDALKLDWQRIVSGVSVGGTCPDRTVGNDGHPSRVVANLPYRIAVPILVRLLQSRIALRDVNILVQAEVASRMTASPRQKDYGRVSVLLQTLCDVRILRKVTAPNFFPRPRIDSSWVQLHPRAHTDSEFVFTWLKPLLDAAFSERRKQLKRLCGGWTPPGASAPCPEMIATAFDDALNARPEELDVEAWNKVAKRLSELANT